MLRLLSSLRRSVIILGNSSISIHIEQQAQLGGPLLRQLGAGLGSTTAAAWEAATSHLDALHLKVSISACVKQVINSLTH
jgi:hypothetical protein